VVAGEYITDGLQEPGFGGSFVCYDPPKFVSVGSANGVVLTYHATPK
jgi:hypothetical protein